MSLTRSAIEAREVAELAPYAMLAAASRGRDHSGNQDPFRTDFQRDRDRIVHSRAFRRLAYKTQVFINDEGDLMRSRLTHTIEVSQLARTAARRLRLNEDLTECIAYAHDLGHPPFGHRGEDLLDQLMAEFGGFDHHRQALRIVEEFEVRYPQWGGLDLTYEVRESVIKHGDGGDDAAPRRFRPDEARLLEAQLVDAVDSIAYHCHDLDDALRAGVIEMADLQVLELWRGAWEQARDISPVGTSDKLIFDRALRVMLDAMLGDVVEQTERNLEEAGVDSVAAVREHEGSLVGFTPSMARAKRELADWLFANVYRDWRVNRTFRKARSILEELFAHYTSFPDCLPDEHQDRAEQLGRERAVADYIAGMTDRYAQEEHQRLFKPFTRSW